MGSCLRQKAFRPVQKGMVIEMEKIAQFSQCYYTSTGGWNAVGSAELPPQEKQSFAAMQSSNAPSNQHYTTPDGKPLRLLEFESDGKYAFITRCQYGLVDLRGRPNMFAHGFATEWKRELIADPAALCFVADESFAADKAAVQLEMQPTCVPIHGFAAAMQEAGFAWNHFAVLTLAVYAAFERNDGKSLYVVTDAEGRALRALIYCIYLSMPYSIRVKLSFADAAVPGAKAKTVVFIKPGMPLPNGAAYFMLQNGENNILTPEWLKKNKKNQFMRNFGSMNGSDAAQQYFAALDKRLAAMGKPGTTSYKLLYLADVLMLMDENAPLPADDLSLLYAMLGAPAPNAAYMDEYIAKLFTRILDAGTELNDELTALALQRFAQTENPSLIAVRLRFRLIRMLSAPLDDAVADFVDIRRHESDNEQSRADYKKAVSFLYESEKGKQILGLAIRALFVEMQHKTYESLSAVCRDCKKLGFSAEDNMQFALEQAYQIFHAAFYGAGSKTEIYQALTGFLDQNFPQSATQELKRRAKQDYWDHYDLTSYSKEKHSEYIVYQLKTHPAYQKALHYAEIRKKQKQLNPDEIARVYLALLSKEDMPLTDKERDFLLESCKNACDISNESESAKLYGSAMVRLSCYQHKRKKTTLLAFLGQTSVSADTEDWYQILTGAPCFMEEGELSEERIEKFCTRIQTEGRESFSEREKTLSTAILAAYQSIYAEKKRQEKDLLKAQREEQRRQRKEQGGVFQKHGGMNRREEEQDAAVEEPLPQEEYSDGWSRSYAAAWQESAPQEEKPQERPSQMESDVIYSGRDLNEMNAAPAPRPNWQETSYKSSYEEEEPVEEEPKKKKLSDFFGKWKK